MYRMSNECIGLTRLLDGCSISWSCIASVPELGHDAKLGCIKYERVVDINKMVATAATPLLQHTYCPLVAGSLSLSKIIKSERARVRDNWAQIKFKEAQSRRRRRRRPFSPRALSALHRPSLCQDRVDIFAASPFHAAHPKVRKVHTYPTAACTYMDAILEMRSNARFLRAMQPRP